MNYSDKALNALAADLCVLPAIPAEKRPSLSGWKAFQTARPNETQIKTWFADAPGLCLVCGAVSGNLEMIDFDAQGEMFGAWWEKVEVAAPGLFDRLVVEQTPSGGYHVAYRCPDPVPGNQRLALRPIVCDSPNPIELHGKKLVPRKIGGRWEVQVTLIETRGEGGLFLCDPTPGYKLQQGDFCQLPVISAAERDILINAAQALNEQVEPARTASVDSGETSGGRPGDDFNARGDVRALLTKHGWSLFRPGENEHWCRPGKDSGTSATLKDGVFYVFSTSAAPFEADRGYSPFQVYSLLEHNGDFAAAASALRAQGYGADENAAGGIAGRADISTLVDNLKRPAVPHAAGNYLSVDELLARRFCPVSGADEDYPLKEAIVGGVLRRAKVMNVVAAPKMHKSWMVVRLAISLATGLEWLGLPVTPGRILHLDNELDENEVRHRYRVVGDKVGIPRNIYRDKIDVISLKGVDIDMASAAPLFEALKNENYSAVIVDALYQVLPEGVNENSNSDMTRVYKMISRYANLLDASFIIVHHTSKGSQGEKRVVDMGAGASAQARAADAHVALYEHNMGENYAVMDMVLRSFPPRSPQVLRWEFPLWHVDQDLDPTDRVGIPAPKAEKHRKACEVDLGEFVRVCIHPRSARESTVLLNAEREFGVGEKQAKSLLASALDLALVKKVQIGSFRNIYIPAGDELAERKSLACATWVLHSDLPAEKVAEKLDISRSTLYNYLGEAGLVTRNIALKDDVKNL